MAQPSAVEDIVQQLSQDPLDLSILGLDQNVVLPLLDLPQERVREIYESIVNDIFSAVNIDPDDAQECWSACVSRLDESHILFSTIITDSTGYHAIEPACRDALACSNGFENSGEGELYLPQAPTPCLSVPDLVTLIALLYYRKVHPSKPSDEVLDMLNKINVAAFLDVAIDVFWITGGSPFLVVQDPFVAEPLVVLKNRTLVAKVSRKTPNKFCTVMQQQGAILCHAPRIGIHMEEDSDSLSVQSFLDRLPTE
ncbi:hypothetical protein HYE67_003949 [Fusarium culmorum]|uniref:Uncharacterized protein n=1 Tax=Fusarium culmorum TaxID=5516 RepID=A0A2T4GMS2_FUSCU|nr:hypothetical protein FCULG_00001123 [Fusarium culmorum]QPC61718.1 hypothetical protein HYE67_003949 [Fusarium culmorum]